MSLTILVHREIPSVGIVRWFLDPKVSISYASGPLIQMSMDEFSTNGWNFIRKHFEEFARVRLQEAQVQRVFEPEEEQKFLKSRRALRVKIEDSGQFTLIPQRFDGYTLGGLESLPKEFRKTIPATSSSDLFWNTFNQVLGVA